MPSEFEEQLLGTYVEHEEYEEDPGTDYRWLNRVFGEQAAVSEVRILALHAHGEKQRFMEKIKAMPGLETVTDLTEQKQALTKQLDGAMRSTAVVMIIFAAVIFFGTILNGTLIALSERQR